MWKNAAVLTSIHSPLRPRAPCALLIAPCLFLTFSAVLLIRRISVTSQTIIWCCEVWRFCRSIVRTNPTPATSPTPWKPFVQMLPDVKRGTCRISSASVLKYIRLLIFRRKSARSLWTSLCKKLSYCLLSGDSPKWKEQLHNFQLLDGNFSLTIHASYTVVDECCFMPKQYMRYNTMWSVSSGVSTGKITSLAWFSENLDKCAFIRMSLLWKPMTIFSNSMCSTSTTQTPYLHIPKLNLMQ